jgi:hypothetical protein
MSPAEPGPGTGPGPRARPEPVLACGAVLARDPLESHPPPGAAALDSDAECTAGPPAGPTRPGLKASSIWNPDHLDKNWQIGTYVSVHCTDMYVHVY